MSCGSLISVKMKEDMLVAKVGMNLVRRDQEHSQTLLL